MSLSRREFLGLSAGLGLAALPAEALSLPGAPPMTPAIHPQYLTGSPDRWPLEALAALGYRGLEISPESLEHPDSWRASAEKAGLGLLGVNAMPELRPYLTGSLTDGVAWRRRATLDRLLATLGRMRAAGIGHLIVAPSRLAENYQAPAEARALLVEALRELASAGDTTILLEALPFRLFASSAEIAAIVDETAKPNVAAALDTGHVLLCGETPARAASTLRTRLRYVQVSDADTRPGVPRLDRHLPPGAGTLDRAELPTVFAGRPFALSLCAPADPLAAARDALHWLGAGR